MNKHSRWVRWTHWINFPLLTIMIWSGLLIYWANDIYWPKLPDRFYDALNLDHKLSLGMGFHFFFMWFFAINGILYFFYLIFSKEWRELFPKKDSFKEAFQVVLHDLGIRKKPLPKEKFNAAQRITYTAIIFMGAGSLITGLAIYKPIQVAFIKNLIGGYETARLIHFYLTVGYVLFFGVHIAQVIRAGWSNFRAMVSSERKRDFRNFAILILGLFSFTCAFFWIKNGERVDGSPSILRANLEFNEKLWTKLTDPKKIDHVKIQVPLTNEPRQNGDLGLEEDIDQANWSMTVQSPIGSGGKNLLRLKMSDLKKLPRTDITVQFKCVEGWSEMMSFGGIKFSDFLKAYGLGTHSGLPPDFEKRRDDFFTHVGLETPDGEYFVSVDMASMLNPQTLLAYEMNGQPLTEEHGAPLRLYVPNKYGVKSLKRIGKIQFADSKLPDFWGKQGYDWFLGL